MKYTFLFTEGKHYSNGQLIQKIKNEVNKRKKNQEKREQQGSLVPFNSPQRNKKKSKDDKSSKKQGSTSPQIELKNDEWGYKKYQNAQAAKSKPESWDQNNGDQNNQSQSTEKKSKRPSGKTLAKIGIPAAVAAGGAAAIYAWWRKKNKNKKKNRRVA